MLYMLQTGLSATCQYVISFDFNALFPRLPSQLSRAFPSKARVELHVKAQVVILTWVPGTSGFPIRYPPGSTNIAGWKMDPLKMYFLLNMADFPASYVSLPEGSDSRNTAEKPGQADSSDPDSSSSSSSENYLEENRKLPNNRITCKGFLINTVPHLSAQ